MPKTILSLLLLLTSSLPAWSDTYLAAGCASTDREWRSADYATLAKLIESKTVEIPLLKHPEGSKVLRRICSSENLAFGQNLTLPFSARIEDFMGIQLALGTITKRFVTDVTSGADHSEEMSLLMSQNLRVSALGIDLMNEFIPTLKRDDTYETRMQGVSKMKSGLATVFSGAYTSIADDSIYSDAERTAMLAVISEVAPKFATTMSPDTRTEMNLKFTKLRNRFTSLKDRESIDATTKALAPTKP
jgi:hypothetical protein